MTVPQGDSVWADALLESRQQINTAVGQAVADGADAATIGKALLDIGPSFDRHGAALEFHHRSRWAQAIALAAVDACRRRRWSAQSVTSWTLIEVLPRLAPFVRPTTRTAIGVAYAAHQLATAGDVYVWVRLLVNGVRTACDIAGPIGDDEFGRISALTAWRAGHVRMRAAALDSAATLPAITAAACLDIAQPAVVRELLERNRYDPTAWLEPPSVAATALRRIGGHRAFGGPWLQVPRIVDGDGLRWQISAGRMWTVIADFHGAAVVPSELSATDLSAGQCVTRGNTMLVASPFSYQLIHARTGLRT
jgi:hypothetical protein